MEYIQDLSREGRTDEATQCVIVSDFARICAARFRRVRHVAGRLKSDFRYSAKRVYNNFPWPLDMNGAKRAAVEKAAQGDK
jgi:hypothetical protein